MIFLNTKIIILFNAQGFNVYGMFFYTAYNYVNEKAVKIIVIKHMNQRNGYYKGVIVL